MVMLFVINTLALVGKPSKDVKKQRRKKARYGQ